jgi:hypothetical protein
LSASRSFQHREIDTGAEPVRVNGGKKLGGKKLPIKKEEATQ